MSRGATTFATAKAIENVAEEKPVTEGIGGAAATGAMWGPTGLVKTKLGATAAGAGIGAIQGALSGEKGAALDNAILFGGLNFLLHKNPTGVNEKEQAEVDALYREATAENVIKEAVKPLVAKATPVIKEQPKVAEAKPEAQKPSVAPEPAVEKAAKAKPGVTTEVSSLKTPAEGSKKIKPQPVSEIKTGAESELPPGMTVYDYTNEFQPMPKGVNISKAWQQPGGVRDPQGNIKKSTQQLLDKDTKAQLTFKLNEAMQSAPADPTTYLKPVKFKIGNYEVTIPNNKEALAAFTKRLNKRG